MQFRDIVVCSFYTADPYYRGHADTLKANLQRLGITHELEEIEKRPGEEWPDICRKKVPFLAGVCARHPDKKVFWIDVDCQLLDLPEYVATFSADLIGFQRGFSSPLTIGYGQRTRFWEPCFFGINATEGGRRFVNDARDVEARTEIRATDDYFFEESWRANSPRLSFQVIPSVAVVAKSSDPDDARNAFFSFGASGNVADFKGQVAQHTRVGGSRWSWIGIRHSARTAVLRGGKFVERHLPDRVAARLRRMSDAVGLTHTLTGGGADAIAASFGSPERRRLIERMIMSAQRGDEEGMNEAVALLESGVPTDAETRAREAAGTFLHYATLNGRQPVPVAWWPRPFPGNFGDWLSPLVVSHVADGPVSYVSPTAKTSDPHLFVIGSIGRFVKERSIVVGTGVSDPSVELDPRATYVSTRGPITAQAVRDSGGPGIESFGDPAVLLRRILPVTPRETNGRIALVRHFTHLPASLELPEDVDELSVMAATPSAIATFVDQLHDYDGVLTSAMHVMIACHSYGIPCALVSFEGFETTVAGTGVKYRDYALGAGVDGVVEPELLPMDLRPVALRDRLTVARIADSKLDEVEQAIKSALAVFDGSDGGR